MDINIAEGIDIYLVNRALQNDRDYSHFHPSAWDKCHRRIAYQWYRAHNLLKIDSSTISIKPALQRTFDVGHYAHYRFGAYLAAYAPKGFMGRWKCLNQLAHSKEDKIYGVDSIYGCTRPKVCECGFANFQYEEIGFHDEETGFGGHVDAVLDLKYWPLNKNTTEKLADEDRYCVVDYKTIHPFAFKGLTCPKPEHQTQMQVYFYLSGLKYGKFLYEDKADQTIKEFLVVRDEQTIAVKTEEAIKLKYTLEHTNSAGKRVLPPRGYDSRGSTECLGCEFREHCWKGIA